MPHLTNIKEFHMNKTLKKTKIICLLAVIFLISACASTSKNRQTQERLLKDLTNKDYVAAKKFVNDSKFYPSENSLLLRLLERGTVEYLNGNFYQALKTFEDAQKISDDLYTRSISRAALSAIGSKSADNYYGEKYERSLIRFYEALLHYCLYRQGEYEAYERKDETGKIVQVPSKTLSENERRTHLIQSRSVLMEWDSLLRSYDIELSGKAVYKSDLVQKLFGAFVHTEIGTREDRQTALQLYRDAQTTLIRNYNIYPSFNEKHIEFERNFSRLPLMSIDKVKSDFIRQSAASESSENFINARLNKLSSNNTDNFTVIVKEGLISPKQVKKVIVGMLPGITGAKIKEGDIFIPVPPQIPIALRALGGDLNTFMGWVLALGVIDFEIPYIADRIEKGAYEVVLIGGDGREIVAPLALIEPLSNIAVREFNNEHSIAKLALSVALEHAAAIVAAYQIWLQNPNDLLTKIAAVASYKAASAAINERYRADLRYWSSLPNTVWMGGAKVADGKYVLFINRIENGRKNKVYENTVEIKGGAFADINL
jgi:hypothetical protein